MLINLNTSKKPPFTTDGSSPYLEPECVNATLYFLSFISKSQRSVSQRIDERGNWSFQCGEMEVGTSRNGM